MYPGWAIIGARDHIGAPDAFTEVVNNARAYAYAASAGLCWLEDCADCESAASVQPGFPYSTPIADPAPWFDPDNPDSWGFLGVIGLDVSGAQDSTRQATVTMGLGGVGTIGRTYMAPRTMVLRALAIAADECSLSYGIEWLRRQYTNAATPCGDEALTFFDCCPCLCEGGEYTTDCWAVNYGELLGDPACATTFWPNTYGELSAGPPADSPDWCMWVDNYYELSTGPPNWSCCADACVVPYLRQFHHARVTEGPTILQQPKMNSRGAMAEIELTIVAADPVVHAIPQHAARAWVTGGEPVVDPPAPAPFVNPYHQVRRKELFRPTPTSRWVRETVPLQRLEERVLSGIEPQVRLRSAELSGPVRLGLWAGEHRVGGYTIPFVAPSSPIVVGGGRAYLSTPDGLEPLGAFVRDWDGRWPQPLDLPHGDYALTVDQDPDQAVRLFVDVTVAAVGSP